MAPPLGNKAAANLANEAPPKRPVQTVTPPKKQRDMSHPSVQVPQAPTTKIQNPDRGMQQNTGPQAPDLPIPRYGPPIPALQRYGVNMSIDDVNNNVDQMAAAHLQAYGYNPSPGLVYDLLKANGVTGPINYNDLFGIAHSTRDAVAMGTARSFAGGSLGNLPVVELQAKDLVKGLTTAVKTDLKRKAGASDFLSSNDLTNQHAQAFWNDNKDQFEQAMKDPHERDQLIKGLMNVAPFSMLALRMNPTLTPELVKRDFATKKLAEIQRGGFSASPGGILGAVIKPFAQIINSTPDMPFGFYQMARGVGLDAFDLSTVAIHNLAGDQIANSIVRERDPHMALHTAHLIQRIGRQVEQDVLHPTNNPGYLLMDIWGAATFGAGTIARVDAALGAESATEAARALVFKRPPASTEMGFNSYHATLPLSDTMAVRWLQQYTPIFGREARQQRLIADQTNGFDENLKEALSNRLFSTEDMLRRARTKENQVMEALALTPAVELTRLARWDAVAKSVFREVIGDWKNKDWKGETIKQKLGVQKALHLILSDAIDPVKEWRGYHERQIQALSQAKAEHVLDNIAGAMEDPEVTADQANEIVNNDPHYRRSQSSFDRAIAAHQAHLEAIHLGEQIIRNPPDRYKPLIDRAHQVAALSEKWMQEVHGSFSDAQANQAIAQVTATVRGEHIIVGPDGMKLVTNNPRADSIIKVHETATRLRENAESRLSRAKATSRLHPGSNDEELAAAQKAVDRHEKAEASAKKRLDALHDESMPLQRAVMENGRINPDVLRMHLEKLARQMGVEVHYGPTELRVGRERYPHFGSRLWNKSVTEYAPHDDTEIIRQAITAAPMEQTEAYPDDRPFVLRDEVHNRDETNNYLAALHELGHSAFYKTERDLANRSAQWIKDMRPRHGGDLNAWKVASKIEREADAWIWAIKHSVEPLRIQVLDQARSFFESYREGFEQMPELRTAPSVREFDKLDAEDTALGEAYAELRKGTPGSAHVPMHTEQYTSDNQNRFFRTVGRFGTKPPEYPIKAWTGKSLQMGDYRMDTTNLLTGQMKNAYRAATAFVNFHDLWDSAVDTRISGHHMPIRDIKTIPQHLREFVQALDRGVADQRFAALATEDKFTALRKHLYPTLDELGDIPVNHIKYVDERLIMDKVGRIPTQFWQTIDDGLAGTMGKINDPMRVLLIFGTPAYLMNALGSASLLLIHTGFLAPKVLVRSMKASHVYGPEVTRIIDRLAGQTHASALETETSMTALGRTSHALQEGWGRITDTYFRRAAVIHELRRHGLLKEELTNEELAKFLAHPDQRKAVSQAAQTARKAMVDYNSLTWPERAILRHIFFVYTFVRNSGIWSLRFLRDHGILSDVLAQSGRDREQKMDALIGHMPEWFMRSGYFAVNPHQIDNPIQWNMPGMLEQIATPVASIFGHTPYSSASELLGPASTVGIESFTGVDSQGRALPGSGGNLWKAIVAQWAQTPLGQIGTKNAKAKKQAANPLKPPQVRASFGNPISAALAHEKSGVNQSVFDNDGFWNTWGQSLFRSGIPRNVNAIAGEARYWRDLRTTNPQAYHQHEMDAVLQMLKRQSKVVGEPVSGDVIRAVDTVAHVSQAIDDFKLKHKGEPTPNEKQIAMITLDTLAQEGHVKNRDEWAKKIKNATDDTEVKSYKLQLLLRSGGQAWKDWVDKVNAIDSYSQPKFVTHMASLKLNGIGDYTAATKADQPTHWAYGRKVERFKAQSTQLAALVGAQTGSARKEALQAWLKFVDSQDKETTINGVTFPSPVAYEFGEKTFQQQYKAVVSYTKKRVSDLSAFQQQLLTGERPDPIVRQAWETLDDWMKDAHANAPLGHAPPTGTYATYFKYLQSKSPAVKKAFDFSLKPLGQRMATYRPIKTSHNASDWDWLLGIVNDRVEVLRHTYLNDQGKPRLNVVSDVWKRNDVPKLLPLVQQRSPAFLSELRVYTGATSDANAEAYLIKFLGKLGSP